ncbi:hypothetical protein AB205_0110800, partial [Aquarana catesbeiana]
MVVADKNCAKIHHITDNIYCCGAGVAADAEYVTQLLSSNMNLHALSTGRQVRVCAANRMLKQLMYRYQGHVGASIITGGVDVQGPHLYSVHPHGSTDKTPYTALGSGQAAAIAVLEDQFKPNMTVEEAKKLVVDAITAGIMCDLGSGSGVDLCVITREGAKVLRGYTETESKGKRASSQTLCVGKPDGKSPMEPKHGRNFRQQAPIAHFSSESPTVCTRHKCSNMVTFNEGTTFSNILLHLEAPLFSFILWSSCWILLLIPLWRLLFVDGHF